jgi:hypothetical protein
MTLSDGLILGGMIGLVVDALGWLCLLIYLIRRG